MKQETQKLIDKLNKELANTANKGIREIVKLDSKLEITFDGLHITEFRCEECDSENVHDSVWDDEDDPHKQDVCLTCDDCDHVTTLRTEEN
jgi:hypothetical protein